MIFISYEETPGGEGVFVYLPSTAAAVQATETRNPRAQHVPRIQQFSQTIGQPVVDILCFTIEKITSDYARVIGQNALDWLMEEGLLRWD